MISANVIDPMFMLIAVEFFYIAMIAMCLVNISTIFRIVTQN